MQKLYLILVALIISNFLPAQQKFSSDYLKHNMNPKYQENLFGGNHNPLKRNLDSWVPINLLSQMWIDNDWLNMAYTEFFYNSNGLLTNDISKSWSDNAWVNNMKTSYTYEGNLKMSAESENWENETWVPYIKSQWTYNENNRVTNIFDQLWMNDQWVNISQTTYTFDGDNCIELLMQDWVNDAWETTHKTTYEYDGEGNNTVSISETLIMGISIKSKEISTYSQGLRTFVLRQNLSGTDWVDASRATYSYNANGLEIEFVGEEWTGAEWVYTMQGLYAYDANGNNTEVLTKNWNGSEWVNFMKLTYNYQSVTDVEDNDITVKDFKLFNNYPNPFNPSTEIKFEIENSDFVELKIFDVLGNLVKTLVNQELASGTYVYNFDARELTSGIYFYRLLSGNFISTKKMTLTK
jgi:hypothetical protein